MPVKSWTQRLLEFALSLVAAGLLLNWAWRLLQPLVPVVVVGAGLVFLTATLLRRLRGW